MESGVNTNSRPLAKNLITVPEQRYRTISGRSSSTCHTDSLPSESSYPSTQNPHSAISVNGSQDPRFNSAEAQRLDFVRKQHLKVSSTTTNLLMVTSTTDKKPTASSLKWNGKGNITSHSIWTTRSHFRPTRSVFPTSESKGLDDLKSPSSVQSYSVVGKPSVKNLLKSFDSTSDAVNEDTAAITAPSNVHNRSSPPSQTSFNSARFMTEVLRSSNNLDMTSDTSRVDQVQTTTTRSDLLTSAILKSSSPIPHRPLFGEVLHAPDGSFNISHGIPRSFRSTSDPSLHPQDPLSDQSSFSPCAWYLGHVELHDLSRSQSQRKSNVNLDEIRENQVKTTDNKFPILSTPISTANIDLDFSSTNNSVDSFLLSTESHDPNNLTANESSSDKSYTTLASATDNIFLTIGSRPSSIRSSRQRSPTLSHVKSKSLEETPSQRDLRSKLAREVEQEYSMSTHERTIPNLALENVDFVARRETVQRAYTNRLRDDEQKQNYAESLPDGPFNLATSKSTAFGWSEDQKEELVALSSTLNPSLIDTVQLRPNDCTAMQRQDSPTLGVPGSFIEDDEPLSTASKLTELKIEAQTGAARLEEILSDGNTSKSQNFYIGAGSRPQQDMSNLEEPEEHSVNSTLFDFEYSLPCEEALSDDQSKHSQVPDGRLFSNEIYSHHSSSSTPRTSTFISFEENEAFVTMKEDSVDQRNSGEEKSMNEENRKRLYQRKMAIKELIDTEAVYLKDMNVVEEIYKGTAEACPNLEIGDIKAIFRNTEEIVSFSNTFLEELKLAAFPIYTPKRRKTRTSMRSTNPSSTDLERFSVAATLNDETEEQRDRRTYIGAIFCKHLSSMQVIYTNFLKNSETASSRLLELQKDPAVKVWLCECNTVAKDLTAAWDLDALLVKPVQRITRYQLLLRQIQASTPDTHPDFETLSTCCQELSNLLKNIDELKKRINMVAKIVGRKRKESDVVRTGIAKAFGRRIEKQNSNSNRSKDDEEHLKIFEKFGDDYLRLQVVLRDAEYYSRQVSSHISDYLRYLSAIESIIRISTTCYPEIESKWTRFNSSMREMGTNLIEEHMSDMKRLVIEPFEKTISAYNGPLLAMKKRDKRKIDFDKAASLKFQGKKVDEKLQNLSNEYSALHETLKWELPKLSKLTEIMGNLILGNFISIQQKWYSLWMDKVQSVLEENQLPTDIPEIIAQFKRDSKYHEARLLDLGIINGSLRSENHLQLSHFKTHSRRVSDVSNKAAPTITDSTHSKRSSINLNGYRTPINSGVQPTSLSFQSSSGDNHLRGIMNSPGERYSRPNTGRSFSSETGLRASHVYNVNYQRESVSARGSYYETTPQVPRPQSRLFNSAMPMEDGEGISQPRDSSRDRTTSRGFNILYLAASLFEFNISATKQEAGYIYLTYQAGEIFDVIGEKGELWLAKNQDDATNTIGWIWSKHFARLAAN
ncbi:hypothetical protein K3495_g2499 [Podosphaera aphanis]|nr:hypothetical protein K3495_g2499 [Podosphaera aphanis]